MNYVLQLTSFTLSQILIVPPEILKPLKLQLCFIKHMDCLEIWIYITTVRLAKQA